MGLLKEFRDFAMRGNVVDMAVGIVIGGAFTKIVSSLVGDVIMPSLGMVVGGLDFSQFRVVLKEAVPADEAVGKAAIEAVTLNYGLFINQIVDFLIIALAVFVVIKLMNRATAMLQKKQSEEAPPAPTTKACPRCCSTIPLAATRCPQCTSELV